MRHILSRRKAKADELYAELQDGANFAKLAKENSTDPGSNKIGGKLPVTKGHRPAFDKAAFELDTGEFSKPIKTQFGWHIIKADSRRQAGQTTPYEDDKASIAQQLAQDKQQTSDQSSGSKELKKALPGRLRGRLRAAAR